MMNEKIMELKLQKIDLMKEIEKYNEKAELLGLEKIIIGGTSNTSTSKDEPSKSLSDRYNSMFHGKDYEDKSDLTAALYKLGFKDAVYSDCGNHKTEDVFFMINQKIKEVNGYNSTYYYVTFS